VLGQRLDDVGGPALVLLDRVAPDGDGAVADGALRVRHHQIWIDLHALAQAVAVHAHAERRVERERLRRELRKADAALGAGVVLRVGARRALPLDNRDQLPLGLAQRGLDRVGDARALALLDDDAVDHQLDVVLLLLLQRLDILEPDDHPVDAHAGEAGLARVGDELAELTLAVLDQRRQQGHLAALVEAHQLADDLVGRPRRHRAAAQMAALLAHARVEHAQVVVDLGDGADRGARVGRGRLLLDGDGRRQAADVIVLGLLHLAEELAGIGRQRLDVAPLALGVERVESERGLARPGHTRHHDQLALGDLQVVDGQVVLARAFYREEVRLAAARARRGGRHGV
jgi:hypothetical protein